MKKRVLKKYNNYKKNKGKLIYVNARRNKKIKKEIFFLKRCMEIHIVGIFIT